MSPFFCFVCTWYACFLCVCVCLFGWAADLFAGLFVCLGCVFVFVCLFAWLFMIGCKFVCFRFACLVVCLFLLFRLFVVCLFAHVFVSVNFPIGFAGCFFRQEGGKILLRTSPSRSSTTKPYFPTVLLATSILFIYFYHLPLS